MMGSQHYYAKLPKEAKNYKRFLFKLEEVLNMILNLSKFN